MPRRPDLHSILVIGSGPIVIGQACEFDYSGTQACKALREECCRVVLLNSNPATIMTDPELADRTYIEPLTLDALEKVIVAEKPDALLPTIGGQTGLNLALEAAAAGLLDRYGVELIGARVDAIERAEDRDKFKSAVQAIGLDVPRSGVAHSLEEAEAIRADLGLPVILRASRTLGGAGGSFASTAEDFRESVTAGLDASPIREILIEESIAGWKEFELEVMRDRMDNVVIVCPIENLDPMGVHTGDSITVAPAQTLTDKEYQAMRDAAVAVMRAIGVDTGGSNVQFAVHPETGRMVVIEMNPRVSRSSALASKATGFPIAKIAAKLAIGYSLDEIQNDITRETPACFEPTLDYVVTKIPRFTFEKFVDASPTLGPQMKAVGEVMSIGRTMKESLQKAMRSMETGSAGFDPRSDVSREEIFERLRVPGPERLWYVGEAFRRGASIESVQAACRIDPWFLRHVAELVSDEQELANRTLVDLDAEDFWELKQAGFSDTRLAALLGADEASLRTRRETLGVRPVFKAVDTCGAEFEAFTPYLYSTYERGQDESAPTDRRKVVILGGGPNRIGQGIEFDYCCVHAAQALREDGFEAIMVNCNPETVSTDYDTSDKLYFEPLTLENVLDIVRTEKPEGVIVQFGGQTPLALAKSLESEGVPILGTPPEAIDRAEDRERFDQVLAKLGLCRPKNGMATSKGDSACSLPPHSIRPIVQDEIRRQAKALAIELGVVGLMNTQFAVRDDAVFVLEVNPRASRTVPFVSKAIGRPLAKIAARCMVGTSLEAQSFTQEETPTQVSIKEAVFPFVKFPGVDSLLGPEMKSTGEVMGTAPTFGAAFAKAQIAAGTALPTDGCAFLSVPPESYGAAAAVATTLADVGLSLRATRGTAAYLRRSGLDVDPVNKVAEGSPHVVDLIREGGVSLLINAPSGLESYRDSFSIRRAALECRVPYFTTMAAAGAAAEAVTVLSRGALSVSPLQDHYPCEAAPGRP